jgi:hypothetical protein
VTRVLSSWPELLVEPVPSPEGSGPSEQEAASKQKKAKTVATRAFVVAR